METLETIIAKTISPEQPTRWPRSLSEADVIVEAQDLMRCMMAEEPRFEYTKGDTISKTLASMIAWIWRDDRYNFMHLDYGKGLWLFGPLGTGKTTLLKGFRKYMARVADRYLVTRDDDYRLCAWYASASEISNLYASKGQPAILDWCSREHNIIVDELGREPMPANNFGTKMNVMQHILQMRYDNRRSCVTHVTTNMAPTDVAKYYGSYVADRCVEMFNFINLNGTSLRQ